MYWKVKLDIKLIKPTFLLLHRDLSSSQRQWDYYRDAVPEPKAIVNAVETVLNRSLTVMAKEDTFPSQVIKYTA